MFVPNRKLPVTRNRNVQCRIWFEQGAVSAIKEWTSRVLLSAADMDTIHSSPFTLVHTDINQQQSSLL